MRASWVCLGEGASGDFDPEDPEDQELLRFDLEFLEDGDSEFQEVPNGSCCTNVALPVSKAELENGLEYILNALPNPYDPEVSVKGICEELSWMDNSTIPTEHPPQSNDEKTPLVLI